MRIKINNPLIEGTLFFSEDFFQNKNITESEMEFGRFFVKNIFNLPLEFPVDDSNINYGQLIKVAAITSRSPRCSDALEHIMGGFQNHIHPIWKSYYNFIFMGPNFGGVPGENSMDLISQIRFNLRRYNDLAPDEKQKCYDLNVLIMEIHLVIKLIVQQIHGNMPQWSNIQNLYNLFDKFEILFDDLFGFHITHTHHNLSLDLYRKVRNSIAHSNFVIQNNLIKLVEWNRDRHVIGILDINVNEIAQEMRLLCTVICQVMALYQLMWQTNNNREL